MPTVDLSVDDSWAYGPGILHGGFLVQLLATHAVALTDHQHPLAVSTHFLRPPTVGRFSVELTPLRSGRSTAVTRAALVQAGRTCLDAVITSGTLVAAEPEYVDAAPPQLPALADCVRNSMPAGQPRNGILEQLDIRVDPAQQWGTVRSEKAEVRGWVSAADGRDPDPLFLLTVCDALPPVTFVMGRVGWVPTVELTAHVRALPAPGPLKVIQRARLISGGWLDEECEVWDSGDRLVAQARQLAAVRD